MPKKDEPVAFSINVQQGDVEDPIQQMRVAVKKMRELMPHHMEMQALLAKAFRIKYEALIKEGFTPEQALFFCRESAF